MSNPKVADYATVARRAFDWVSAVAVEVDGGLGWLEDDVLFDDLYSGTAGVLLGCAEAAASGLDLAHLADGARLRLLRLVNGEPFPDTVPDDGLFGGWAGIAVALRAWFRATGDVDAEAAAAEITARVAGRILLAPLRDPARYNDVISGDAGILIALLADKSPAARQAADVLADRLAGMAEVAEEGLQWRMAPGWPSIMPGFSHGTSGVAYALAVAGHTLNRPDLLAVAERGAEALLALGHTPHGWALPLQIPPQPNRPSVNYGWCHGPTGTVRLFLTLLAVDPQARWQDAVEACLQALRDSRIPARLYPGYWDNHARCCGTAGVGQLLLQRYQAAGDSALLDWADGLAADLLDRALATRDGVTWSNIEYTRTPPDLPAQPGFMQGTAGIAGWLARLDATHNHPRTPLAPVRPDLEWI